MPDDEIEQEAEVTEAPAQQTQAAVQPEQVQPARPAQLPEPARSITVSVNTISRLLPYALLALIGVAGWSMNSTLLLAVVVAGTAAVAIGTSTGGRSKNPPAADAT